MSDGVASIFASDDSVNDLMNLINNRLSCTLRNLDWNTSDRVQGTFCTPSSKRMYIASSGLKSM